MNHKREKTQTSNTQDIKREKNKSKLIDYRLDGNRDGKLKSTRTKLFIRTHFKIT
jgi:hypothetical protein